MAFITSGSELNTRAGPVMVGFLRPVILATHPSGERLPRRMARWPVSLATRSTQYLPGAARFVRDLIERFKSDPPQETLLLNVNLPAVTYENLGAPLVTRLGKRHKAEPVIKTTSPRNETVYWVGAVGPAADAGPGTDFHAVAAGRVSITPLQIDLTYHDQLSRVGAWLAR